MRTLATTVCALTITLSALLPAAAHADEIGFIEDFALAKDREAALKQLIPGTQDYYYYHCLHYLNTEQFDKVDELLKPWITRYGHTQQVWEIMHRSALLTYHRSPQQTLNYLRDRLNLQFNHQREDLGRDANLPTALDQTLISRERLFEDAIRYDNLARFEDSAFDWLIKRDLDEKRRHHLLERLQRPDYPNLVQMIVADLGTRYTGSFGQLNIHRQLLLPQLEEVLKLAPHLINDTQFVYAYLLKLQPASDVDLWTNDKAMDAYLTRLWNFVSRLGPVHNSLKAHVLFHRLEFDRAHGVYNKDLFMTYIALPRNVVYINPKYMQVEEHRRHAANLNAGYNPQTPFRPIGTDEELVRSYLQHFFLTENTVKPYEPYIESGYLERVFAETKLVNGLGDAERWYSMLSPTYLQQLKERVDLDFAYTNREHFAIDEPVSVDVYVKNVKTLLVKVYEINTSNYYRDHLDEVDTDITLDGLTPNWEQTFTYDEAPLRRVKRHFEFPQLAQRGVFVIDFIGNGKNSRVLVRKGKLRFIARDSVAGHVLTILDEKSTVVPGAVVQLVGQRYVADEDGEVLIPYSNDPGLKPIVISMGSQGGKVLGLEAPSAFSSLDRFNHEAENYELNAGIYVDREMLLERRKAHVMVRASLKLNGTPVTLSVLEDVRLVIVSVDLDGVETSKEVSGFELFEDRESVYEFQTPSRLKQIRFTLRAKVKNLSQDQKVELAASETFTLNQIELTDKIEDVFFAKVGGRYMVSLLGRTGEAKPGRAVHFNIKHRDFKQPVQVTLATNDAGRIMLGELAGITQVTGTTPEGVSHTWVIDEQETTHPNFVHGRAGEPVLIPYMGSAEKPQPDELSLLELRAGTYVADWLERATITHGYIRIDDLPHGDYSLLIKPSNTEIRIRLTEGPKLGQYVIGDHLQLQVQDPDPLQIVEVNADATSVKIKLANAGEFARVHVFATRYKPEYSAFEQLARVRQPEPFVFVRPAAKTVYIAGRELGDEMRYILERKYAPKYPGNMLDRPSLLLNPWAIRDTETDKQDAGFGADFGGAGGQRGGGAGRPAPRTTAPPQTADFSSLDFLADTSVALMNMKPDENGELTIPREDLHGRQIIKVVAVDPEQTVMRRVTLEDPDVEHLDLRLSRGLAPDQHYTEQKQVTVVGKDEQFQLDDITTAKFEAYDNLARVYGLYVTLTRNDTLIEFNFVIDWPNLTAAEKREKYSKYACHELNYFVYQKDPKFFEEVVQPYLRNKKDKSFLDHWLIGADLSQYLSPWAYGRLNTVERILLAQRIAGEQEHTSRHINERFHLLPSDPQRQEHLFQTAIKGSELETGDRLGIEAAARDAAPMERLKEAEKLGDRMRALNGQAPAADAAREPQSAAAGAAPGNARPAAPPAPQLAAKKDTKSDKAEADDQANFARRRAADFADEKAKGYYAEGRELRREAQQLYRKLDKTKEWVENNYYHLPIEQQDADLVTVNAFWQDWANHDFTKPFYSTHMAHASRNFTEMMFALSVLDIPFKSGEHKTEFEQTRMTLRPGSYMIVYHKQIRQAEVADEKTPVLVNQNFFRHGDRHRMVDNERVDKFVTDEFLVHTVYGAQVVVTNPTSTTQKLTVLLQIPVGALPVLGGQKTRAVQLDLQPYSTQKLEYFFYFPREGEYAHYPVHVAKDEKVIAFAEPFRFNVVRELTQIDKGSWQYISQHGSQDDVIEYLKNNNIQNIDLGKIAWRMQDEAFFKQVTDLLATNHVYSDVLWSYGIKHNAVPQIRQYLKHAESFLAQVGLTIDSELVTIDPVDRFWYQHMEYAPLVNARTHALGKERQILNDRFHQQYHRFMKLLSYKRTLSDSEKLAVTYYMSLQDRVEEAIAFFNEVNADNVPAKLQYDYVAAYLDFYAPQPKLAASLASKYADHPVDRWRNRFQEVQAQLEQIQGGEVKIVDKDDRTQQQTKAAAAQPGIDFTVEARKITLHYQNLKQVTVNYYQMDIEMLFSRNPFVQEFGGTFSYIRPNKSVLVELPQDANTTTFELPDEFRNSNVLVEVAGGGQSKQKAYYANSLVVQTIENYGQVSVSHAGTGRPLPRTYVKVYARMNNGQVKFYKDGYTDLRGRFDYTSLNTNELEAVDKFSILVLNEEHGAVVREAQPPAR